MLVRHIKSYSSLQIHDCIVFTNLSITSTNIFKAGLSNYTKNWTKQLHSIEDKISRFVNTKENVQYVYLSQASISLLKLIKNIYVGVWSLIFLFIFCTIRGTCSSYSLNEYRIKINNLHNIQTLFFHFEF